jgi:hypothetical protein
MTFDIFIKMASKKVNCKTTLLNHSDVNYKKTAGLQNVLISFYLEFILPSVHYNPAGLL